MTHFLLILLSIIHTALPFVYKRTSFSSTLRMAATSGEIDPSSPAFRKWLAGAALATGVFLRIAQPVVDPSFNALQKLQHLTVPLQDAACLEKPMVIEFYTNGCAECKALAPRLLSAATSYGDRVSFVALDGTRPENEEYVRAFNVDGIPHVVFVRKDGSIATTLVGGIPRRLLLNNIQALTEDTNVPTMGAVASGVESVRTLCAQS